MSSFVLVAVLIAISQNVHETGGIPVETPDVKSLKNALLKHSHFFQTRLLKAFEMRSYMNESSDPCTDFYTFSCGNWPKLYPANPQDVFTGRFPQMSSELARKNLHMLKTTQDPEDTEIDRKVKDFYESCTNFVSLITDSDYRELLLQIIAEFGEMPALSGDAWNATNFDWQEIVARIAHKYGKSIIVLLEIMPDFAMNTINRIYVGNPDFHLGSRSMYTEEVTAVYRQEYKDEMAMQLHKYLGLKEELARKVAAESVEFEVSLARGLVDEKLPQGLVELSEFTTTKAMVQKYAPTLNIEKFINIAIGKDVSESIYEYSEAYQRNLVEVLKSTPKQIVANYIMYTFLDDFLLNVTEAQIKTEKFCLEKTKKYFAKNLDNMIHRRYNISSSEHEVNAIWQRLKQAFGEELQAEKMDWISIKTRQKALEKLNAMKMEINTYETNNFSEEFGSLIIRKDDFMGNIKNILELRSRRNIATLYEKPKPIDAAETLSFTPAYVLMENTVKVPLMVLQSNYFWGPTYPNALNFGAMGSLLGHELIHGFDDSGQKYGSDGNAINWWDADSSDAFDQRKQCFTDQYSQYSYGGRLLPVTLLQEENIADHGAVRIAYASYLRWLQQAVDSEANLVYPETLPFMNYTNKQLFFISFAQIWCNDADPSVFNKLTASDVHVPGKFRAIGPLSNIPEFSKEFNCGKDTPMNVNENKRCEIY